jgi:putative acetyltransferase
MRSDVIWFQKSNLKGPPEHAVNCLRVKKWLGNRENMIELVFKPNLLDQPAVQALVHSHLMHAVAKTPQESAHGLDLSGLQSPDVRFWTLWAADALHAIGAWKQLSATEAELKSMHVAEAVRRQGTGSLLLKYLIDDAQAAGIQTLYLQTGSGAFFAPAVALYRRHGFAECQPFSNYREDRNSIYMSRRCASWVREN